MKKTRQKNRSTQKHRSRTPDTRRYETVTAEGLEDVARRELAIKLDKRVELLRTPGYAEPGTGYFLYGGGPRALLRMKTIQAIYLVRHFDIPRPLALLGDENFRTLLGDINFVRQAHDPGSFRTFFISAAGAESSAFKRLKKELGRNLKLAEGDEEGDLLLRFRRPLDRQPGWEAMIRISPRPLNTRAWRVCNMEGALNATVAHTMALMTDPMPHDVYLNIGCGSGTLLIERLAAAPARRVIGCDTDAVALDCARQNIAAAGYDGQIEVEDWDARSLPLEDASVDALTADLPFGHLVGSHEENTALYPALLAEAARVARRGALFVVITHEIKLMQSLLAESHLWRLAGEQRVALGGLYPRIFVLERQP